MKNAPHSLSERFAKQLKSSARRRVLRGVSMAGTAAALGPLVAMLGVRSAAAAANKHVTLSMSGGSYMSNWQREIIDPFQKLTGIQVTMVPGSFHTHAMQLRASSGTPPFDVFMGDGYDAVSLISGGRFLPLTSDRVPSISEVYDKFKAPWGEYAALIDYASVGLAYSTERVKKPPTSWREFVDRTAAGDFDNKVFFNGFPGVRGPEVLMTLSRVFGGDPKNIDAGFEAIKRIKPHVFKFFTTFNAPVELLMSGEGDIGPGWDGRTYIAHDESHGKVDWIAPEEGVAAGGPVLAVVKGGNADAAYALVNYALGATAQKAFCEAMGYGAVNRNVVYSERLSKRIPPAAKALVADDGFIAANLSKWVERWNREIA